MDDMIRFEDRFEDRVRAFAMTGVQSVDSAAVARSVALGYPKRPGLGSAARRLRFTLDRRAWGLVLVAALLVALVGGALVVGARLLPPPSPVNLRLAYELDGDIYLADWDGADSIRIVDGNPAAACPDMVGQSGLVAPDGLHFAYRASWGDGCPNTVIITDLNGNIVASLPAGVGWNVGWSPNASRVATWLAAEGEIGVYGIDGAREAVLHVPDGYCVCGDHDPVWSPDGESLLLPMSRNDPAGDVVVELPIDGGTPQPVPADDPRSRRQVAFSPDGARAAFIVFIEEPYSVKLSMAASDGSDLEALIAVITAEHLTGTPVWSAASDRVAVVMNRDSGSGLVSSLRVVDVTTRIETALAAVPGRGLLRILGFSPEGDRLLVSQDAQGDAALWSVDTDGSGARLLVAGASVGGWLTSPVDAEPPATP